MTEKITEIHRLNKFCDLNCNKNNKDWSCFLIKLPIKVIWLKIKQIINYYALSDIYQFLSKKIDAQNPKV